MLGMLKKDRGEMSRKPTYSRFTQQELPACRLLLTPAVVIQTLFVIGAIFIPLGAVCLLASNQVVEVVTRYDNTCLPNLSVEEASALLQKGNPTNLCQLSITIPSNMNPPIYMYYQLTNFYQNYRRYVKSQSEAQLSGSNLTAGELGVCAPEDQTAGGLPIVPCGLIAWSLFNDSYSLAAAPVGAPSAPLAIDSSDISWPSDRSSKFANVPSQNFNNNATVRGGANISTTLSNAQNLQVWMRTAALPTFRKLYGEISVPLAAGTVVNVNLQNLYNSYAYGGTKSLVLSTSSWLGGKNSFLGIAYFTVGGVCITLSIIFFILQFTNYRPLGDTAYLSWNKKAADLREPLAPMPPVEALAENASTATGTTQSTAQ